ncbi:thyroid transcription factor 1-associated protein 26 isoform X1 [Arapaima gigas]
MRATNQKMKNKGDLNRKGAEKNQLKGNQRGFGKAKPNKRKWVPQDKFFDGSKREGQGFAFKRRQKVQHEYNKLLRKGKFTPRGQVPFEEQYPDHLKHLYLAEAEQLKKEEETRRQNRSKRQQAAVSEEDHFEAESSEAPGSTVSSFVPQDSATGSLDVIPENKKKNKRKTSYQKAKEEYERVCEKRTKKKEAYLKNKLQREEALRIYQEKKHQTYQILSKKTKKGQPNLNLQMDFLLQKIQESSK